MKRKAQYILAFIIATVGVCIANFLLQLVLLFIDIVTRLSSTSAMIIVLWVVTGIFGALFTMGMAEQLAGKDNFSSRQAATVVFITSLVAVVLAVYFLSNGHFRHNPYEFSLLLSNGYVFLSYFIGAGAMAVLLGKMDETP